MTRGGTEERLLRRQVGYAIDHGANGGDRERRIREALTDLDRTHRRMAAVWAADPRFAGATLASEVVPLIPSPKSTRAWMLRQLDRVAPGHTFTPADTRDELRAALIGITHQTPQEAS